MFKSSIFSIFPLYFPSTTNRYCSIILLKGCDLLSNSFANVSSSVTYDSNSSNKLFLCFSLSSVSPNLSLTLLLNFMMEFRYYGLAVTANRVLPFSFPFIYHPSYSALSGCSLCFFSCKKLGLKGSIFKMASTSLAYLIESTMSLRSYNRLESYICLVVIRSIAFIMIALHFLIWKELPKR